MPGGSGGTTTTQTNTSEPWSGAKPHLEGIMDEAAWLYGKGGNSYYPGATYIGPTKNETDAMGQIESTARQGNPFTGSMTSQFNSIMNNQGLAQGQREAMQPLQGIASGQNNIGGGYLDSIRSMAGGGMVGENNPHVMKALELAADKAGQAVNSSMGAGGRLGSGAHQGTLSREIGGMYANTLADQYNKDRSAQMQAAGLASGVEGANIANAAGASQSIIDTLGQGSQTALQYSALAPQMDAMRYSDAERLMGLGAGQRGELQTQLADNVKRWEAKNNAGWDNLSKYLSIVGGTPMFSNTQTQVPQGSPLMGFLGGAMGGGQVGSMFGPWGTAIGSGLGGIFGMR